MADYNAHTYFGMRVLRDLPPDLRRKCAEDLPVFRTALYGPDPLIFGVRTKRLSDYLHKIWRDETLPALQRTIRLGEPTVRSFAAGYLLHQLLDDVVHPMIYRWMAEGASHFRLELELDAIILQEQGLARSPHLYTKDKRRTAQAAAQFIRPATGEQYLTGLWRMAVFTNYFRPQRQRSYENVTEQERTQTRVLREMLEEGIWSAAGRLAGLLD